jgi:hypothetical protein
MVIYDMVMIPMSVFPLPHNLFLKSMLWNTRLFWSLDMLVSCVTGVVMPNGAVKLELRFIIKRYLKTWFVMDFFIVGSDWGTFLLAQSGGAGFVTRFSRVFRTVRAVRLLRLARMKDVLTSITERIQSDSLSFMLNILKVVLFVLSMAHVIACVWFAIGNRSDDDGWVASFGYINAGVGEQYLVSMHWAMMQFTGGSDEITPKDVLERFFAMFIWTFTFVAASVIVSILTSELTQMHIVGGNVARQMATLRKYLKQNFISSNLALRMQRSAQHVLSGDLKPDLVELLPVVAEPLRVEMHFEMYSESFRKHPFFSDFIIEAPLVMRRIGHYATSTLLLTAGDVICSEGEAPSNPSMYFVMKGNIAYENENNSSAVNVIEGQWFAEPSIWTTWIYQGTFTASTDGKLAMLDAKAFQEIVNRFKDAASSTFDPKEYAARFCRFLNESEDISDISVMKYLR